MKPKAKKLLLGGVSLGVAAAIGAGIFFGTRGKSQPVGVYPFDQVGMTEYWGDSQESYGPVTTDKIQTVFLSETQTVTEVLVSEGDSVKKGDLLMTFDTTLSDLALERKRLEVEKFKLQLETAKQELQKIKEMKPMELPPEDDSEDGEEADRGTLLKEPYRISVSKSYDGSTPELALICWIRDNTNVDDALLEALRQTAEEYQNYNAANRPPEPEEPEEGEEYTIQQLSSVTEETITETTEATQPEETKAEETQPEETKPEETITPTQPEETIHVSGYYVVFRVTEGNMSMGNRTQWQGLKVNCTGGAYTFRFFDANYTPDHMLALELGDQEEADGEEDRIDLGSGFTAEQIAQMRREKEKSIKELEFQVKMADADYKIAQTELADGNIYAEFDGKVTSVLTEEEARDQGVAVLKVSGGGGFYVEGSVSELERDNLEMGQEVKVNDWNTGMTYPGTVVSIGDFPSQDDGWSGSGNPNVTYYPLMVFVDETAELQAGRYASITFSAASSQHGLYLRNPFLRTEQGRSFVYVQGANGKLEKRFVTTGKSLWGSYTEILGGLSETDLIAFPYGKTVKEGAAAAEGDVSDLYGY